MEILENREQWWATFRAGWLAHYEQTGKFAWKKYNRPKNQTPIAGPGVTLSESRLMLISSAGGYLPDKQTPFDAPHPLGDYSIRCFPSSTPLDEIAYAHDHYNQSAVKEDPQVLLPLRHLDQLVAEGAIGELTPSVVNFMGYQPDVTRVLDEMIPAIIDVALGENAHAALLVPA